MPEMFETKTMLKAVNQAKKPQSFLRDFFFGTRKTFDTKHVEIDIVKAKRKVAPFVSPKIEGKIVTSKGFSRNTYEPALLKPKTVTDAEEIFNVSPGHNVYSDKDPETKAAEQLGEDLAYLEDMITRREELMCAEAMFSGQVTQKGEGVDEVIDFSFTNTVVLSGTDKWSDEVNSDPIADIKTWRSQILKASGISPDTCLMHTDVAEAFINHPKVQKILDIKSIELGKIDPKQLPDGSTYIGTIKSLGIDVYSYEEWYIDEEDGQEKSMVPENKLWLGSRRADFKMLHGAIADAEKGLFEVERYPKSWTTNDPSARFVMLQSKPLPVPTLVDSMLVATVL